MEKLDNQITYTIVNFNGYINIKYKKMYSNFPFLKKNSSNFFEYIKDTHINNNDIKIEN